VDPAEVLHASDRDQRDAACLVEVEPVEHTGVPDNDAVMVVPRGEPKRAAIIFVVLPLPGHGPCEGGRARRTTVMKEASDEEGMGSTQRSCMERGSETMTLLPAPCVSRPTGLRSMPLPLPRPDGRIAVRLRRRGGGRHRARGTVWRRSHGGRHCGHDWGTTGSILGSRIGSERT
jgi:hypothetical protein